jgi:hypothetical protein
VVFAEAARWRFGDFDVAAVFLVPAVLPDPSVLLDPMDGADLAVEVVST